MRPILAVLAVALILGLVGWFQRFQDQVRQRHAPGTSRTSRTVDGRLLLEILTTHQAQAELSFQSDGNSVVMQLDGGRWSYAQQEPLEAGQPLLVSIEESLRQGRHELFVRIAGSMESTSLPRAARVRVGDGVQVFGEANWFSGGGGAPLAGVIRFDFQPSAQVVSN